MVGGYLAGGVRDLATRHPCIGDVRGAGLCLGVELVGRNGSGDPDPVTAHRVKNDLREQGILVGTTGRDGNVLKIRPPMVFSRDHADRLLETLDDVLGT